MVMASYYVQREALTWASLYVSLPVAFIVTAILHVNNLPRYLRGPGGGEAEHRRSIGVASSRWLYAGYLASAYLSIAAVAVAGVVGPWALLGLAPLPWAVGRGARAVRGGRAPPR